MEELLLRALLAGEELNVIDQQRIERAVRRLELVDRVVLQGAHHVADEALRMNVRDARLAVPRLDEMRDRVHQVCLAESHATIEEQRVIGAARILRDLQGGRFRELIALALDEGGEAEIRIQARADDQAIGPARARGHGRSDCAAYRGAARAHLDRDDRGVSRTLIAQQLADPRQQILVDPVDDESIRRQQLQRAGPLERLQRTHPGIELLLGKLGLQRAHASSPKGRFHARCLRDRLSSGAEGKGCEVYTDRGAR